MSEMIGRKVIVPRERERGVGEVVKWEPLVHSTTDALVRSSKMRLKIEICLENAAFEGDPVTEVNSIIQGQVLPMLSDGEGYDHLRDSNGNSVGFAKVVED